MNSALTCVILVGMFALTVGLLEGKNQGDLLCTLYARLKEE